MNNIEIAKPDTNARRNANALALTFAVLVGVSLTLLLLRGAVATPFSDEFYFFELYRSAKEGRIDFNEILRPHFGHVYVLLKSWLWLVVHFEMDWRVSMYVGAVFTALTAMLTLRYTLVRSTPVMQLPLALAIAMAIGSLRQAENVYWAMQASGPVMIFFAFAAFYAVAKYVESANNNYAVLAFTCAFLSFLSTGGGLFAFSLTVIALCFFAKTKVLRIGSAVIGIVFLVGAAMVTRQALESGGPAPSLLGMKNYAVYTLAFVANAFYSFSERGDDIRTLSLGAAILACCVYTVKLSWKEKERHVFAYLLMGFALASCVAIAYARLKGGIWQPNAPRYYPSAVAIVLGNLMILGRFASKRDTGLALIIVASVCISFVQIYRFEWAASPHRQMGLSRAHASLCSGSIDGLAFFGDLQYTNPRIIRQVFCSKQDMAAIERTSQPFLYGMGPDQTTRKVVFNPYNGESAMWMRTENCEHFCTLVFAGVELPVVVAEHGTLLTATIPRELYEMPGEKPVYIKNRQSQKQSRTLIFKVN